MYISIYRKIINKRDGYRKVKISRPLPQPFYFFVFFLWYTLTTCQWIWILLFSGPLVDIMGGTIFITARSIMAKIVRPDELGWNWTLFYFIFSFSIDIYGLTFICFILHYRTSDGHLRNRRIARPDRIRAVIHDYLQKHSDHTPRIVQFNWIDIGCAGHRHILVSINKSHRFDYRQ